MLGSKVHKKFVDNMLGRKLTIPLNSLGTKLVRGGPIKHHHNNQNQEEKAVKSYLEKR